MAGSREFQPSCAYLARAIARAGGAKSEAEANEIVREAAGRLGLGNAESYPVEDFLKLCEGLKARGGIQEFVASMASSAAKLFLAAQTLRGGAAAPAAAAHAPRGVR